MQQIVSVDCITISVSISISIDRVDNSFDFGIGRIVIIDDVGANDVVVIGIVVSVYVGVVFGVVITRVDTTTGIDAIVYITGVHSTRRRIIRNVDVDVAWVVCRINIAAGITINITMDDIAAVVVHVGGRQRWRGCGRHQVFGQVGDGRLVERRGRRHRRMVVVLHHEGYG